MNLQRFTALTAGAIALASAGAAADIAALAGLVQESAAPLSLDEGGLESDSTLNIIREASGLTLGSNLEVDFLGAGSFSGAWQTYRPGDVLAGAKIDVFLVHLDAAENLDSLLSGVISFDTEILGIIVSGALLDASDAVVGIPGVIYRPHGDKYRGAEGPLENFTVAGDLNKIYVTLHGAFDEIRIITVSTVPAPGVMGLLGLGGLMASRRRRG